MAKKAAARGVKPRAAGEPASEPQEPRRRGGKPDRGRNDRARGTSSSESALVADAAAGRAANGASTAVATRSLRAEPAAPRFRRYVGDLWRHRSAFVYFARGWVRKRTGRTLLGGLWLFLPVLLPLFMGALVFGGILGVSIPGVPYFLYLIVASSGWILFSQTTYFSIRSIEIFRSEIRRVYVPRLIPLTAGMTLSVIMLLIYVVIAALAVGFYVLERDEFYLELQPATLLVPCAYAMLLAYAFAVAVWLAPVAARARDVRRLAGYALGMWYFLTPVLYPIEEIPADWRWLASLNPVTAPIEIIKEGLINVGDVTVIGLAIYFGTLILIGGAGLHNFAKKERRDMAIY